MISLYNSCMDAPRIVHIALPAPVVDRLDEQALDQLRSRSNLAAFLIQESLRQRADMDHEEAS